MFNNVFDHIPIVNFIVEIRFYKEDGQRPEFRISLYIYSEVYLMHFGTHKENPGFRIAILHVSQHIKNNGSLTHTEGADNHIVHTTGQPLV